MRAIPRKWIKFPTGCSARVWGAFLFDGDGAARVIRAAQEGFSSTVDAIFARRLADARAFGKASEGLAATHPDLSAKSGLTITQRAWGWAIVIAYAAVLFAFPARTLTVSALILGAIFSLLIGLRVMATVSALSAKSPAHPRLADSQLSVLTILIPLHREEPHVVRALVNAIARLDYPSDKLDVKIIIEADDAKTISAVLDIRLPAWFEIIPVPPGNPRTKPKALNYGLASARGQFVAVFDAEDRPSPDQPRAAMAAFQSGGRSIAVVQAPLLIHNGRDGWLARQFQIEYAIHFKVWLPFLARLRLPLALGGTSNYFCRGMLETAGGWDAWNVTEDADIGLRLARFGGEARMIAPPTLEEAPSSLTPWMNQRTRWMKGHLQTWLVLMRKPFRAMREIGLLRFAAVQLTLGGALLASALHAPLLLWLPFGLALGGMEPWQFLLFGIGYASTIAAGLAADRHGARLIERLSAPLYWPLQSIAMLRALIEMKLRPHFWAKTPHHLADIAPVDIREIAVTAPQNLRGDNVIQLEFPFDPPGNAGAR